MSTASESKDKSTVSTGKAHELAQGKASCSLRVHGRQTDKTATRELREKLRRKTKNSITLEEHPGSENRGEDDRSEASVD